MAFLDLIDRNKELDENESNKLDYIKHIVKHSDIDGDISDFITGKIPKGFGTGIAPLDNHILAKKNEFYGLVGKKGRGKTTVSQSLHVMWSIVNKLTWVVAFQENSEWSMKMNYMNYLLCDFASKVKREDPVLYDLALRWVEKYFIFIDVDDIKTATTVTQGLIESGRDIHGLVLDPINSFGNGWQDTGNAHSDGVVAARRLLNFSKKWCSVHISQHPTMAGQRQQEDVNSYQAEGGWFLNKCSFTWSINRDSGSSDNRIGVDNVRNRHTGGEETNHEDPLILEWSPTGVNIGYQQGNTEYDVIRALVERYNPLGRKIKEKKKEEIPLANLEEAFGEDKSIKDVPF